MLGGVIRLQSGYRGREKAVWATFWGGTLARYVWRAWGVPWLASDILEMHPLIPAFSTSTLRRHVLATYVCVLRIFCPREIVWTAVVWPSNSDFPVLRQSSTNNFSLVPDVGRYWISMCVLASFHSDKIPGVANLKSDRLIWGTHFKRFHDHLDCCGVRWQWCRVCGTKLLSSWPGSKRGEELTRHSCAPQLLDCISLFVLRACASCFPKQVPWPCLLGFWLDLWLIPIAAGGTIPSLSRPSPRSPLSFRSL